MATTISWPTTLPQFVLESGYSRTRRTNVVRTTTSTGPAKVRRRNTKRIDDIQFSMIMSKSELDIFETFFFSDLGLGTLSFNFPEPEDSTSTIEVRFSSEQQAYAITPEPGTGYFSVAFSLETL